jgi:uroporphyrinogen-III synthase
MTLPLAGRTVALAEGRQLEELTRMLEAEGAATLPCPMVSILDAPDEAPVLAWLHDLVADRFGWVVLFTGEGLRRLLGFADRAGMRETAIAALARTRTLTRGPKPVKALQEIGLKPTEIAAAPTTNGVITALRKHDLSGVIVGVQHYSDSNPALSAFLSEAGASEHGVLPYVYAPRSDADRVVDLIRRLASGTIDVMVFTSAMQVDRLNEVAVELRIEAELRDGLTKTLVAAVGPVVAENLRGRGAKVDICPEQGWQMKNLVQHIKRALTTDGQRPKR